MTEPQSSHGATLLARKGHAAPFGAPLDAAAEAAPLQAPAAAPAGEPVGKPVGAAPAASLLPLDFMAQRQSSSDLTQLFPKASEPVSAPEAPAPDGKPETPRAAPALRVDSAAKLSSPPEPRRFPALAAGLALALVLGAAGYGYQNGWLESEAPADAVTEAPAVTPAGASPGASPATPSEAASDPDAEADRSSEPDQSSATGQRSEAVRPSVDVVRIEPDGAAVIAGRAAPGTELILLDNGTPIGTAQADAYGEWVFIPIDPLPSGAHDFGLVLKNIEGGISVPSLDKMPPKKTHPKEDAAAPGVPSPNEPGTARGAAAAVPIPPRKPDTAALRPVAVSFPAFVVQLASVKTRGGAEREWQTLQLRYPEILSELTPSLDEAKLAGGDTVVRLRIGVFSGQAEATALCERLAAKHQDCLVVRSAAHE